MLLFLGSIVLPWTIRSLGKLFRNWRGPWGKVGFVGTFVFQNQKNIVQQILGDTPVSLHLCSMFVRFFRYIWRARCEG